MSPPPDSPENDNLHFLTVAGHRGTVSRKKRLARNVTVDNVLGFIGLIGR